MPFPITTQINQTALKLIKSSPKGIRWAELIRQLQAAHPTFHPKTINGCVWKLAEKFPEQVERPEKGLFRYIQGK